MDSSWTLRDRSTFVNEILNCKRYGPTNEGGTSKLVHLTHLDFLRDLKLTSNNPFTMLLRSFKDLIVERYRPDSRAGCTLPEFLDPEEYEKLNYKHEKIIDIFTAALLSPGWPKDSPTMNSITRSKSFVTLVSSSSKRSRTCCEGVSTSTSSKRHNSGSLTW
ncbi:hypothetical protein BJV78DRAFT_135521 [Lactifluus subvellereus]|nr:hypothetical protein BJV78DRAFT_135521 [Lactifluus subvellereus]